MPEKGSNRPRILIIDDESGIRKMLCDILEPGYECQTASSAEEGLRELRTNEVALVISDINMAGITGLEMVPQILALAPDTVVIMMSGMQTIETAIEAMRVGAFDYLMKPFDLRHVRAAVRRALDHYALRLAKQHYESQLEEKVQERTAALRKTTEELQEQIAERNRAEERVNYLAYYDLLTQLPNRALFRDRLAQSLGLAHRDNQILGVLRLSIDRLKNITDTLGPAMGDQLVCQIAGRLKESMRDGDTLGYWGSDEFAFLFTQLESAEGVIEIAQRMQLALEPPFNLDGHEIYATSSAGIVLYPLNGEDEETLMKNAGAALFQAKERGGNNYEFYTAGMNSTALERLSMEGSLRRAIEREEFVIHYQPKVDVNTWQIVGAEALIRWQHPERGLLPPAEFILLAEDAGLMSDIGDWCLRASCLQLQRWNSSGSHSLTISSNISARRFQQPDFFGSVAAMLQAIGLDPNHVELELTESSIMTNPESAIKTLNALKSIGVKISVDDFGTGFSSLAYLKRLPIDILKIDRSFVNDATTDPADAALVMAIITLAHNLRLKVVAEGVETEEQLKFLHLLRCDEIQGFLFSKPLPAEEFEELLVRGQFASKDWNERRQKLRIKLDQKPMITAA
jgi:diguanylate cyclase (GGDEF)-like protein